MNKSELSGLKPGQGVYFPHSSNPGKIWIVDELGSKITVIHDQGDPSNVTYFNNNNLGIVEVCKDVKPVVEPVEAPIVEPAKRRTPAKHTARK